MRGLPYVPTPERGGARLCGPVVTVICLTFWLGVRSSAGSYGTGSPVGSATVPPTSYESGLIRSGNPMNTGGNLVVTGNVAGGRHFRDSIPYSGTTGFRGPLGSSSLDSFLRYSGDPEDFGGYTGSYRPFYSPSGTVATTQPGIAGVFAPSATRIMGRAPDIYAPSAVFPITGTGRQGLYAGDSSAGRAGLTGPQMQYTGPVQYRPMSRTPQELEGIILSEFPADPRSETATPFAKQSEQDPALSAERDTIRERTHMGPEQYQERMERFRRELAQIREETAGLEQKLATEGISTKDYSPQEQPGTGTQVQALTDRMGELSVVEPRLSRKRADRYENPAASESGDGSLAVPRQWTPSRSGTGETRWTEGTASTATGGYLDIKRQTRRQLDGLESLQSSIVQADDDSDAVQDRTELKLPSGTGKGVEADKALQEMSSHLGSLEPESTTIRSDWIPGSRLRSEVVEESPIKRPTALEGLKALSQDDIASRAQQIMGSHKTLASFSQAKFDHYVKAGAEYLKQGKYYRAADAYTMASIYKPNDPLANVGKSHALFAAGEYMSSALFLSRALQVYAEYSLFKIDMAAAVGGKDKLDDRVLDIQEGIEISDAPELQFLLAYVYYQMGSLGAAKEQIDAAYKKLPNSPAVQAVRKAIYSP